MRLSPTVLFRDLGLTLALLPLAAAGAHGGSMTPSLEERLVSAGPDEWVPVVVLMEQFPEREKLLAEVRGLNREARRAHVVTQLRKLARQSQASVHNSLAERRGSFRRVRVLWGVNGVALEATPRVIEELADLPGVLKVLHDHATGHTETSDSTRSRPSTPQPRGSGHGSSPTGGSDGFGPTGGDISGPNPDAVIAPDIAALGAPQVWHDLGYTGAGVIVAVIDTGIDPTHPDLADHMWTNLDELPGNGLDDDGNGYVDDTWGWDFCTGSNVPDAGWHGTAVAGQVAGDGTDGMVTGMAPDAELMALGIDCDTPSKSWEASDYAIANGAHLITQSYSWWWTDQPDYEAFRRQADTELAAGLVHVNSAGNSGQLTSTRPVPYNISTPANCPAPWIHPDQTLVGGVSSTIAVGNVSWTTDAIHSTSSIGPAAWEDIRANTDPLYPHTMAAEYQDYPYENGAQLGLIKPDISAYGDGTESTCPGPSYCQFSGTSSAAPHVSGTIALMLSSNPEATPAELAEAILTTAQHRGDPGKNNVYGVGLVQAFASVQTVETGVLYDSHVFDDTEEGNGDLAIDPGERVRMAITVRNVTDDVAVDGLEAILSTTTPGVTIHERYATYPSVPARGTATSHAPHYSLTVDPDLCATNVVFDLELRFGGKVRRSSFVVRVGDETPLTLLDDDFETDLGWTSDPGIASQGYWVREDPIGVFDGQGRLTNPEDDSSPAGVTCWVTGNGELNGKKDENNNDVDGGVVTLLSPPFGSLHLLSLDLTYDRWYYDPAGGPADALRIEFSNDGGASWALVDEVSYNFGGWESHSANLFALMPPTDDMRLRFTASDGVDDGPVEAAIDEVNVQGMWVDCQDHTPPSTLPPNPVGESLRIEANAGGHARLSWEAPPVDPTHDPARLYRIERSTSPDGPFTEAGSATETWWIDVDALGSSASYYYRVVAE